MKLDNYTKTILTIIACTLIILVFQNTLEIKSINAQQNNIMKVAICDINENGSSLEPRCVKVKNNTMIVAICDSNKKDNCAGIIEPVIPTLGKSAGKLQVDINKD